MTKGKVVQIRLSEDEKAILDARAAHAGKSVSDLVRETLCGAVPVITEPPVITDEDAEEARALELAGKGMAHAVAKRVARQEALGVREVDGPLKSRYRKHPNAKQINSPKEKARKMALIDQVMGGKLAN